MLTSRNYVGEVKIDSPKELYLSGDHVKGTFIVNARSTLTVSNIQVKLRCDEEAWPYIRNADGGEYQHNRERYISVDSTVFPEHPVPYGDSNEQPNFTLKEGTHTFDFDFEIPMGPGSIPNSNYRSELYWYVKGVVHRSSKLSKLSKAVMAKKTIMVCPNVMTPLDLTKMSSQSETITMNAYLPGYNERVKSLAGRLKETFSHKSDLRRQVEVTCNLKVPEDGIPQAPATLPIEVDLSSSDEELLFVTKFELDLEYKLHVSAYYGEDNRIRYNIFEMEFNSPVKQALAAIRDRVSHTTIESTLPATFKSDHFDLEYKLVGTIYVISKENKNHAKKIRVSIPALIRNKCDCTGETPPYEPGKPESEQLSDLPEKIQEPEAVRDNEK